MLHLSILAAVLVKGMGLGAELVGRESTITLAASLEDEADLLDGKTLGF